MKVESVIRVGRLAAVAGEILVGAIGYVSEKRLTRIKNHLAEWLTQN